MTGGIHIEEIRAAVSARVASIGSPLVASPEVYEFIRGGTRSPVHGEFAIGVVSTTPLNESRQRPDSGTHATTDLRVLFAWQLVSPVDRVTSFDAMLVLGRSIRNALLVRGWYPNLGLLWARSEHSAGPDGWLWAEHTFTAHHALPLA